MNETNVLRCAPVETVNDVLRRTAELHGQREAYIDGTSRMTYHELERAAGGFAAFLQGHGVRQGDVIALCIPSSIEFAVCYLGAMRIGAVTSAINTRLGPRERASIIDRARPTVSIAPDDDAAPVPGNDGIVIRRSELAGAFATAPAPPASSLAPTDAVAIVWTSGTTGMPKGAVYHHANMRAIHDGMGELSVAGDRRVVSLPFAHVGYMTRAWDDIYNAITMVLVKEPWSATVQLELVAREHITMITGVPTQWAKMLDHPLLDAIDTSALRLAGIGGAAVAPELVRLMRERLGCAVMTRYTSTEAGLATSTRLTDDDETIATTVGMPSSIVEMRLVDPATEQPVATGEVGEIRLRSPAMFAGYWNDPEESAASLDNDGFLRTGDLGLSRPDGNLRIVGRLKEMYIRGGYNVYPAEVEAVLTDHPAIGAAAVVGANVEVLGEIGVAFIVANNDDAQLSLAEVRDWCGSHLADYKSPERIVFVKQLPVNAMHKVDKQHLRELAKEHV